MHSDFPGEAAHCLSAGGDRKQVKALLKKLVLKILPGRAVQAVKKFHYARMLRSISEDDEKDIRVVKHLVKPGGAAADVGANFGIYTKFLSELVGPAGHVYSVEPFPLTFDVLRYNVKKLHLENVELVNAAVSDKNGTVTMEVPLYQSGGENFYEARIVHGEGNGSLRQATVQAYSLDSLFADAPHRVSFIKCDVEGNELKCIRGAVAVIENFRPAWHIEIMGDPDEAGADAAQVFEELKRKGYEAYWFDGRTLKQRAKGERNDNYFFLTPEHLQTLEAGGFPVQNDS